MQKLLLLLFLAGWVSLAEAQENAGTATSPEILTLKEIRFDFGKIPQGKPVTHIFEVKNSGKVPLQLENVQASCGCTTPEWTKEPIAPGATQNITVGYNAAAKGPFEKTITIYYNSGKTKQIFIKGEVWETPATPAPENASVQLLKNINH